MNGSNLFMNTRLSLFQVTRQVRSRLRVRIYRSFDNWIRIPWHCRRLILYPGVLTCTVPSKACFHYFRRNASFDGHVLQVEILLQ